MDDLCYENKYDREVQDRMSFYELISQFDKKLEGKNQVERIRKKWEFFSETLPNHSQNYFFHFMFAKYCEEIGEKMSLARIHYQKAFDLNPDNKALIKEFRLLCQKQGWQEEPIMKIEIDTISDPYDDGFEVTDEDSLIKAKAFLEKLVRYDVSRNSIKRLIKSILLFSPDDPVVKKIIHQYFHLEWSQFLEHKALFFVKQTETLFILDTFIKSMDYPRALKSFEYLLNMKELSVKTGESFLKFIVLLGLKKEEKLLEEAKKMNTEMIKISNEKDKYLVRVFEHAIWEGDVSMLEEVMGEIVKRKEHSFLLRDSLKISNAAAQKLKDLYLKLSPQPDQSLLDSFGQKTLRTPPIEYQISSKMREYDNQVLSLGYHLMAEPKQILFSEFANLYFEDITNLQSTRFLKKLITVSYAFSDKTLYNKISAKFQDMFGVLNEESKFSEILKISELFRNSSFMMMSEYMALSLEAALKLERSRDAFDMYQQLSSTFPECASSFDNRFGPNQQRFVGCTEASEEQGVLEVVKGENVGDVLFLLQNKLFKKKNGNGVEYFYFYHESGQDYSVISLVLKKEREVIDAQTVAYDPNNKKKSFHEDVLMKQLEVSEEFFSHHLFRLNGVEAEGKTVSYPNYLSLKAWEQIAKADLFSDFSPHDPDFYV